MSYEERRILEMRRKYIKVMFDLYKSGEISLHAFEEEADVIAVSVSDILRDNKSIIEIKKTRE